MVFVYDPLLRLPIATLAFARGPHALAFDSDPVRPRAYLGDFTHSAVHVVDLMTFERTLTIGAPETPPEL